MPTNSTGGQHPSSTWRALESQIRDRPPAAPSEIAAAHPAARSSRIPSRDRSRDAVASAFTYTAFTYTAFTYTAFTFTAFTFTAFTFTAFA